MVDGKQAGDRAFNPASLSLDEFTLGARFYTNGPGAQQVRGWVAADIAEVLVYGRVLPAAEAVKVRDYLTTKHAELKRLLPGTLPSSGGKPLESIPDPPPVQMFVPGFTVRELPLDLTNINNLRYRADGKLVALAYDGNVYLLTDTDGDGLEDKAELFWDNKGRLRSPIGMALTPPDYKHGHGVFVASQGEVLADRGHRQRRQGRQGDHRRRGLEGAAARRRRPGRRDRQGRQRLLRPRTANFTNAYLIDKDGKPQVHARRRARHDPQGLAGLQEARDRLHRHPLPGRPGVQRRGDLFCTDQEGATWLPNGNPFDELLHIQNGPALRLPAAAPAAPAQRDRRAERLRLRPAASVDVRAHASTSRSTAAQSSARRPGPATRWSPATRAASCTARSS